MYRTTRYDLALFLLMVHTNVSYTVVGAFIVQKEEEGSIAAALRHIKDEMDSHGFVWDGSFWMADKSWPIHNGVKAVFPGYLPS